jgi:D-arabinose 1-dehydrogenase-like Zn-dependent alcohol dehydrogenase
MTLFRHFGIQFAKALGAEVVAFSHSPGKKVLPLSTGSRYQLTLKNLRTTQ